MTTHRAPAKLNLGLEIVGRRPDDYHELVTIFQAISIYDELTVAPASPGTLTLTSQPALAGEENLVLRAARALAAQASTPVGAALTLTKGIPVAAGLGGGSSDAATTLRALLAHWQLPLADTTLHHLATQLGADVPFFLRGGTTLATGIGEQLLPLPALAPCWFVILTPPLDLPADKTRRLYAALQADDFSPGTATYAQAEQLRQGGQLLPELLCNSFAAPLTRIAPAISAWQQRFLAAGAPFVQISGSGPTLYTLVAEREQGQAIQQALRQETAQVYLAHPVAADSSIAGSAGSR